MVIIIPQISPVRDWRSTPLEWLSSTRDLDLDLGSGHTAYRRASVIDLYLHTKYEKVFVDGRTYGRTYLMTDGHFPPLMLLGRLRGVDLQIGQIMGEVEPQGVGCRVFCHHQGWELCRGTCCASCGSGQTAQPCPSTEKKLNFAFESMHFRIFSIYYSDTRDGFKLWTAMLNCRHIPATKQAATVESMW